MKAMSFIPLLGVALAGTAVLAPRPQSLVGTRRFPVSGSGMDIASEAIIHSEETTATGMIRT